MLFKYEPPYCPEWVPITDKRVKPIYFLSNYGHVYNYKKGKYLKPFKDIDGYRRYSLQGVNGKKIKFYEHRLVGTYFVPHDKPIAELEINHINGIKHENIYSMFEKNLEWVTHKANIKHSHDTNLQVISLPYTHDREFIKYICECFQKGLKRKEVLIELNKRFGIDIKQAKYTTLIKRVKARKVYKEISINYIFQK